MKTKTRTRPDEMQGKSIKQLNEQFGAVVRRNVRKVSVHSAGDGAASGTTSSVFVPNAEQLAKINTFTRKEVTADDVIAFKLDAMNDLYDRDDERFLSETVDDFANLKQPFSFVGKSYMVDHDYKMANARGRIFDVGTETKETPLGTAKFLTPSVYTPNTPQYADFIEGLEFGINWACSVGVVVDKSLCSICAAPVHSSSWSGWAWCQAGHEKGYYYVPGAEEDDGWGFYLPVDPSTKGAVKAMVDLKGAVDGYEISSVFLGAQYMAQLADKSAVRKIFRAAEKSGLPILGLSYEEAKSITLPHEPEQVQEARKRFNVVTEDGVVKWADEANLVWAWDSNGSADDILCLGKSINKDADDDGEDDIDDTEDDDTEDLDAEDDADDSGDEDDEDDDQGSETAASGGKGADDSSDDAAGQHAGSGRTASAVKALLARLGKAPADEPGETETDDDLAEIAQAIDGLADALDVVADDLLEALGLTEEDEGAATGTTASAGKGSSIKSSDILRAAKKAKLPSAIVGKLADAEGNGLDDLLAECSKTIKTQDKEIKILAPRAEMGDKYVKEVEADALHWFTVSRRDLKNPGKGVNVSFAQKMINRCEGDPELIKELAQDWKKEAQAKFPQSSRRSTVPADPNERTDKMPDVPFGPHEEDGPTAKVVSRLHRTGRE